MKNLIHKFKFNKHSFIKEKLLDTIDKSPFIKVNDNDDSISKSDYFIQDIDKEYINFIQPHIKEFMTTSLRSFKINGFIIGKMWFQQYHKNDIHKWHSHKHTHFACVYYAEMSNNNQKTLIKNFGSDELIEYEASEGDIIMFPAYLYHSSPLINTENRKTIISFNLDIT